MGSVLVSNTVTFTDANFDAATAGQSALLAIYQSGDVSGIFGTAFGDVGVTNVTSTNAKNPSERLLRVVYRCLYSMCFTACGAL